MGRDGLDLHHPIHVLLVRVSCLGSRYLLRHPTSLMADGSELRHYGRPSPYHVGYHPIDTGRTPLLAWACHLPLIPSMESETVSQSGDLAA
jgi:hypothetical protein